VIQPPTAAVNWMANVLERLMRRYAIS